MTIALALFTGLLLGALFGAALAARAQRRLADARVADAERAGEQRVADLLAGRQGLADQMRAVASEALKESREHLAAMGKEMRATDVQAAEKVLSQREAEFRKLTQPIADGLKRIEGEVRSLDEQSKVTSALLQNVGEGIVGLSGETAALKKALRQPHTRGAWGEVQLQRCVEMAGMTQHVDFELQHTLKTEDSVLRPDALVLLPGDGRIVVDSKISLEAYLDALEAENDTDRRDHLARHAGHVRDHVKSLASKRYQDQFKAGQTPDFVVCFIASEGAFHAAFEADANLFGHALGESVLIATPTNLIAILRTIELGWRQERLAAEAQQIADAARELHGRFGKVLGDISTVGKRLSSVVEAYNGAVGSVQGRVLPQLRRIDELGAGSGKDLAEPASLDKTVRALDAPELDEAETATEATVAELPPPRRDAA